MDTLTWTTARTLKEGHAVKLDEDARRLLLRLCLPIALGYLVSLGLAVSIALWFGVW